ncbi:MAG: rod-binding protein [Alphaproteobacteria bacterium]|nr:rod-binding protein [Alphaproteobacteria bacterium]
MDALSNITAASQPQIQNNVQNRAQIEKAAKDFEAMFLSEMVSHMFSGLETDPMFGGGKGEEIFRSMMVQEYGKMIADGPGIGVSDQIMKAMIDMQSVQGGQK